MKHLLVRLACLRHGHEPGERDWVGRPMQCERCGTDAAEMGRRVRLRFLGEAARRDWNDQALREAAWAEQAAAMNGEWPPSHEAERLLDDLKHHMDPARYDEFVANLERQDGDPEVAVGSF